MPRLRDSPIRARIPEYAASAMSETRTDPTRPTPPGLTSSEPGRPPHPVVGELLARSNRLGADPRNTNYAGGNTSAKGSATDPVTGRAVELLWVKGSGGDLGTLTEAGLAVLRLERIRSLVEVYPGVARRPAPSCSRRTR